MITALLSIVLFMLAAIAVDVGRWYSEGARVQRAADAAALAGVPFLPDHLGQARTEARSLLDANGYDGAAVSDSDITYGDRTTQLKVRLTSTIPNTFASVLGARFKAVTRTAVAEFTPPAVMGSTCNVLGNDPPDAGGQRGASAACRTANYWSSIGGPDTPKWTSDQFSARWCVSGNSGCSGGRNLDYWGGRDVLGQPYYVYRVRAERPVSSMSVQVFDPMLVNVGSYCQRNLSGTPNGIWVAGAVPDRPNPFVTDAVSRYSWGVDRGTNASLGEVPGPGGRWTGQFCTGDGLGTAAAASQFWTSFLVVNPTDSQNALRSTPATCQGITNRPRSFGAFNGDLTKALVATDPRYNAEVARYFRQWENLCTIDNPQVGRDYYLVVRTNVPRNPSVSTMLGSGDAPSGGDGANQYGLRVLVGGSPSADVSLSAVERLPIFVNQRDVTSTVDLVRVPSSMAGSRMTVTVFDIGNSAGASSFWITNPSGTAPSGCQADGDVRTGPTGSACGLSAVTASDGFDGRVQRIRVPIPTDYTCDDDNPQACWYRLDFVYQPGAVNDQMTWTARVDSDQVQLVQ